MGGPSSRAGAGPSKILMCQISVGKARVEAIKNVIEMN